MTVEQFEQDVLPKLSQQLTEAAQANPFKESRVFEDKVREVLSSLLNEDYDLSPKAQVFPDITVDEFGIEVKFTTGDNWRSIGNSVFEGSRVQSVEHIYLIYGKMGGTPEVRWGRYEECVVHVRTTHVPRFEVEVRGDETRPARQSLFSRFGISYADFSKLTIEERMTYVRKYARENHAGENLWWLEAKPAEDQWSPTELRLFTDLSNDEKDKYRAETALLFPEIVQSAEGGNNMLGKYDELTFHILRRYSVICSNVRDMFSAGSALREYAKIKPKGGAHLPWVLRRLEKQIFAAAATLEDEFFREYWQEYWDESLNHEEPTERAMRRVARWLRQADRYATGWKPSEFLFQAEEAETISLPPENIS